MCFSIVLSTNNWNYRKVAQYHYNLTDEQMEKIDVHHNPPICEGGRNIPEHLYIYHPTMHKAIHNKQALEWARKSSGNKNGKRGKPATKIEPTSQELKILKLRQSGLSRKEVADFLGLKEHQVKRAVKECSKFGYKLHLKPGPKKGCKQRGGNPTGINQFKKAPIDIRLWTCYHYLNKKRKELMNKQK